MDTLYYCLCSDVKSQYSKLSFNFHGTLYYEWSGYLNLSCRLLVSVSVLLLIHQLKRPTILMKTFCDHLIS